VLNDLGYYYLSLRSSISLYFPSKFFSYGVVVLCGAFSLDVAQSKRLAKLPTRVATMDISSDDAMPVAGPDLSSAGMDMSNETMASDFLVALLDDTLLQPGDWTIAEAFWYGIIIVIATSAIINLTKWATLRTR
jgi:hypothetical protein